MHPVLLLNAINAVAVPLRSGSETIWASAGAILAGAVMICGDSVVSQVLAHRRRSDPAKNWEASTAAVMGLIANDATGSAAFTALLRRPTTRQIAIDALTNEARSNPEVMRCLRGRAEDIELIGRWVSDALASKDPGRRAYACEVVAMVRMRAGRGSMLAAVSDEDSTVRVAACRSLAVIDPEATVGVLLGLLDSEGPWAASLLGDLVQRLPEDAVLSLIRRATEWGASPALVRLLATVPTGLANAVLLDSLDDVDPDVRARSAEAIHASSPETRNALFGLLTDQDEATRLGAVRSFSRSTDGSGLLALFAALSDASRVVRLAAADGLSQSAEGIRLLQRARLSSTEPAVLEAAELALWRVDEHLVSVAPSPAPVPGPQAASALLVQAALGEADAAVLGPLQRRPKAEAGTSVRWLLQEFERRGPTVEASVIRSAARTDGISSSSLDRARRELADIEGFGAQAMWTLRDRHPVPS